MGLFDKKQPTSVNPEEEYKKQHLDLFKDPFQKNCIKTIRLEMDANWFTEGYTFSGYIRFKNGNTEGSQLFEGISLPDIASQIDNFIKSL